MPKLFTLHRVSPETIGNIPEKYIGPLVWALICNHGTGPIWLVDADYLPSHAALAAWAESDPGTSVERVRLTIEGDFEPYKILRLGRVRPAKPPGTADAAYARALKTAGLFWRLATDRQRRGYFYFPDKEGRIVHAAMKQRERRAKNRMNRFP